MSYPGPIQWYPSQVDLMWPNGTFSYCKQFICTMNKYRKPSFFCFLGIGPKVLTSFYYIST